MDTIWYDIWWWNEMLMLRMIFLFFCSSIFKMNVLLTSVVDVKHGYSYHWLDWLYCCYHYCYCYCIVACEATIVMSQIDVYASQENTIYWEWRRRKATRCHCDCRYDGHCDCRCSCHDLCSWMLIHTCSSVQCRADIGILCTWYFYEYQEEEEEFRVQRWIEERECLFARLG